MMDAVFQTAKALSIVAFLFFGLACLLSQRMVAEFERYGLARFRVLVGSLETAGAVGLLAGYVWPVLVIPAAAGLSLLMLLGVATRIRIRDSVPALLPALGLCVLNGYVAVHAVG